MTEQDYQPVNIGSDEALTKDKLNRLALNQKYLYDKVYVEAPRGVVLWKQHTSSNILINSNRILSEFNFNWQPEEGRKYLATFSIPYTSGYTTESTSSRATIAIYYDGESQNGIVTWEYSDTSTRSGHTIRTIIDNPPAESKSLYVWVEKIYTGPSIVLHANSQYPITFWVEDVGRAGGVVKR